MVVGKLRRGTEEVAPWLVGRVVQEVDKLRRALRAVGVLAGLVPGEVAERLLEVFRRVVQPVGQAPAPLTDRELSRRFTELTGKKTTLKGKLGEHEGGKGHGTPSCGRRKSGWAGEGTGGGGRGEDPGQRGRGEEWEESRSGFGWVARVVVERSASKAAVKKKNGKCCGAGSGIEIDGKLVTRVLWMRLLRELAGW